MFVGTPDQVLAQIKKHWKHVDGYDHLLIMGQPGFLEHDDTVHGIRIFAREVCPGLKVLYPDALLGCGGPSPRVAPRRTEESAIRSNQQDKALPLRLAETNPFSLTVSL